MGNKRTGRKNGRPSIFTPEVIAKLEYVFAMGGSDREACLYASVSPAALYEYQKINPDFLERKKLLKESPVLLARQTVIRALDSDSKLAFEFLKAKKSDEFISRQEHSGPNGGPIQVQTLADLVVGAAQPHDTNSKSNQSGDSDLADAA